MVKTSISETPRPSAAGLGRPLAVLKDYLPARDEDQNPVFYRRASRGEICRASGLRIDGARDARHCKHDSGEDKSDRATQTEPYAPSATEPGG